MNAVPAASDDDREYPARPMVGVAAVVISDGKVLLVRRGRPPMPGRWSLPGGLLQLGERMAEGVVREVREETGVSVAALRILSTLDFVERDAADRVRFHYVLVDWLCAVLGERSEPRAGDDALAAAWVLLEQVRQSHYELGEEMAEVICRGAATVKTELGVQDR